MKRSYKNIRMFSRAILIAILLMMILKIPIVYAMGNELGNLHTEK